MFVAKDRVERDEEDLVRLYLTDIGQYTLLTKDDEVRLAKAIEAAHPGFGAKFKPAANHRRGIVAWVEREGLFRLGDAVRLHIPDQRPWKLLGEALRA